MMRLAGGAQPAVPLQPFARELCTQILARPNGELAVALAASDMPTRTHRSGPAPDVEPLVSWAWQGIGRLGLGVIVQAAAQDRALSYKYLTGGLTSQERAEYRRLWPSERRKTVAVDNASWLKGTLAALAGRRPVPAGIAAYLAGRGILIKDIV